MFVKYFPILGWIKHYSYDDFANDSVAAIVVTIMLIPQSLAYALLAGLPPEIGLYASIIPLVLYSIFGTSKTLAVGPVAVIALMTFAACSKFANPGTTEFVSIAIIIAILSGIILLVMGILKLGFITNFLSHPVISGFITASGLIIAASQLKHIFGVNGDGSNLVEISTNLFVNISDISVVTFFIGSASLLILYWAKKNFKTFLIDLKISEFISDLVSRTGPIIAVILTTSFVWFFGLGENYVSIVGSIPKGLPTIEFPEITLDIFLELFIPALLISIVGYVETVSIAQTLAAKRREKIDHNQELIALGFSNFGSGLSGGLPVTGGFARSVVNFDAGAKTPAAGALTAIGIAFSTLFLTPLLYYLPKATLAATIMIAVLSLVDFKSIFKVFSYSSADGVAMISTIIVTLSFGVEIGIVSGVVLSILMFLYRTSTPHIAKVGQVPGTEHYRNVNRHMVVSSKKAICLRIDESLYFPNARFLEDSIYKSVINNKKIKHIIIMCSAINYIDSSALESLEFINNRLNEAGVKLHLSEVKGPVMDQLKRTNFLEELTGEIYLTNFQAFLKLDPELAQRALKLKYN